MLILATTLRYRSRFDDNRARRVDREECGEVDHQRDSAVVAPLVNRPWSLHERVARSYDDSFSGSDHPRLPSRIVALAPLDFAREDCVSQLSLDEDADLAAWVVVHREHRSGHHRHSAECKFRILDDDRRSATKNFACDGYWCRGFRCSVLGEREVRVTSGHECHAA